ncbi:MAG: hypothetical protein IBX55_16690 [Methyloprofundus sp.]|nr:hypothetical protein [Methyloprofundus sp.]
MDNIALNQWRDKLGLPFSGIREAKLQLSMLEAKYERLSSEARQLLDSYNDMVRNKTSPVYLHRASSNTSKILKWRLSGSKLFNFGDKARSYALLTPEVLGLLKSVLDDDPTLLQKIVEFDFKRTHLNYALSYTFSEAKRLESYIEEFEVWRKLPSLVNSL